MPRARPLNLTPIDHQFCVLIGLLFVKLKDFLAALDALAEDADATPASRSTSYNELFGNPDVTFDVNKAPVEVVPPPE